MEKIIPDRIHIIGSVGSGKTTLAKELSSKLDIPYYELDNVIWKRSALGDERRAVKERTDYLYSILQREYWIIEGVKSDDWVRDCFYHADIIIFLDTRYSIRTYRLIKRFFKQKLRMEKSNYKPTWKIFLNMFKWNHYFEKVEKVNFFNNYYRYEDKIKIIRNTNGIKKYFNLKNRRTL